MTHSSMRKPLINLFPALGLLAVLTGCAGAGDPTADTASVMPSSAEMAQEAERRGDWSTAARHWQGIVDAQPANRPAVLALVRSLRFTNNCGRAAPYLERLRVSGAADDLDARLETGKCHLVSGRLDAAEATLREAIADHPDSWEAQTVLATTLDHMEEHREALVHHDRAVTLAPDNAIAISNKAISLALSGRLDDALILLRMAAGRANAPSRVRMNLALLEAVAGNGDIAVMMARQEVQGQGQAESVRLLERIAAAAEAKIKPERKPTGRP
jgi:Flp pilus assembly protein TadD